MAYSSFQCFLCLQDLKTMTERLKNRYYVTKKLFIADLQRIISNCREYNPPDSEYCKSANTLEKFFYFKLKDGGLIEKWASSKSPSQEKSYKISPYWSWVSKLVNFTRKVGLWGNKTKSKPAEHFTCQKNTSLSLFYEFFCCLTWWKSNRQYPCFTEKNQSLRYKLQNRFFAH